MQLKPKRAIITLVWAGSIIAAGPAIGYAQVASGRLSEQSAAANQRSDISGYAPATVDTREEADGQHFWMLGDPLRAARDLAARLDD